MSTLETRMDNMERDIQEIKAALGICNGVNPEPAQPEEPSSDLSIKQRVTRCLLSIGIPSNVRGYAYIREATMIAVHNPRVIEAITKELYPAVAKKFQTTPARVERAIRHAIEVAWIRGDTEYHETLFGYSVDRFKGHPTNSHFIAALADYIVTTGGTDEMD